VGSKRKGENKTAVDRPKGTLRKEVGKSEKGVHTVCGKSGVRCSRRREVTISSKGPKPATITERSRGGTVYGRNPEKSWGPIT